MWNLGVKGHPTYPHPSPYWDHPQGIHGEPNRRVPYVQARDMLNTASRHRAVHARAMHHPTWSKYMHASAA